MFKRLLLLNGISVICVILFHAAGWGFVAMFSWAHQYMPAAATDFDQLGSIAYYVLQTIEQLVVFAVPSFLFVSGFFVAFATGRTHSNMAWATIWARIKKMAIPYLIWSGALIFGLLLQGTIYSPDKYLKMLLTGQANPAYYYVPLLIQYYLLSPLIIPLAKKHWLPLLIVTGIIQIAVQLTYYPAILGFDQPMVQTLSTLIPKWLFLSRLFWFTLGVVVGFHLTELKLWLERVKWVWLTLAVVLLPLGVLEWEFYLHISGQQWMDPRETLLDSVYTLAVILSFLAFDQIASIPFSKQIADLGSKSYGIYLIHSPVMTFAARGIYHFAPAILGYQIIFQPIMIILGLGVPVIFMEIVNRSPARRFYQYLFG